jgi:hypothetical protein
MIRRSLSFRVKKCIFLQFCALYLLYERIFVFIDLLACSLKSSPKTSFRSQTVKRGEIGFDDSITANQSNYTRQI